MQLSGAVSVWGLGRNAASQGHLCEKSALEQPQGVCHPLCWNDREAECQPSSDTFKCFPHLKQCLL